MIYEEYKKLPKVVKNTCFRVASFTDFRHGTITKTKFDVSILSMEKTSVLNNFLHKFNNSPKQNIRRYNKKAYSILYLYLNSMPSNGYLPKLNGKLWRCVFFILIPLNVSKKYIELYMYHEFEHEDLTKYSNKEFERAKNEIGDFLRTLKRTTVNYIQKYKTAIQLENIAFVGLKSCDYIKINGLIANKSYMYNRLEITIFNQRYEINSQKYEVDHNIPLTIQKNLLKFFCRAYDYTKKREITNSVYGKETDKEFKVNRLEFDKKDIMYRNREVGIPEDIIELFERYHSLDDIKKKVFIDSVILYNNGLNLYASRNIEEGVTQFYVSLENFSIFYLNNYSFKKYNSKSTSHEHVVQFIEEIVGEKIVNDSFGIISIGDLIDITYDIRNFNTHRGSYIMQLDKMIYKYSVDLYSRIDLLEYITQFALIKWLIEYTTEQ